MLGFLESARAPRITVVSCHQITGQVGGDVPEQDPQVSDEVDVDVPEQDPGVSDEVDGDVPEQDPQGNRGS